MVYVVSSDECDDGKRQQKKGIKKKFQSFFDWHVM